jgi:hypothetical protein
VTWGKNKFVALGLDGAIMTSPDGNTWTARTSGVSRDTLLDVSWSDGLFVAAGWDSTDHGIILVSPDGISWERRTTGYLGWLCGVTLYNGKFVAVGFNGTISAFQGAILTSSDGVNWTNRISGTKEILMNVIWANNQFVAVGDSGAVFTSPYSAPVINACRSPFEQKKLLIEHNTVRYTLPAAAPISIRLFTIQGRLAKTLLDCRQEPGSYAVAFPSYLPEGGYVLSFRSGNEKIDRTVIVTR